MSKNKKKITKEYDDFEMDNNDTFENIEQIDEELYDDNDELDDNDDNEDEDDDEEENEKNEDKDLNIEDAEININKYNINEDYEYSDYDEVEKEKVKSNLLPKEKRISNNKLTKYEMVRILGERTKQLTMGAKPLIKNYKGLSYDKIAEEELKLDMTPFKIKRYLPNGKYEIWLLSELNKEHLLLLLE